MQDTALYNILHELKRNYLLEGVEMPYTIEDYKREVARDLLAEMSAEEVLEYVNHRKLLEGMPARERLEGMPARERLEGLSRAEIEEYLKHLRSEPPLESDG
jgi:hypothetical protein